MTQIIKPVDVTRSFIPMDPSAYPFNLHGTGREDSPETLPPVVAYAGANFMPTAEGYKSFYGIKAVLGVEAITSRVQQIVVFQTLSYDVYLLALAEDGIWIKKGTEAGSWTHSVVHEFEAAVYKQWTWTLLSGEFYCYREGFANYYKIAAGPSTSLIDMVQAGITIPTVTVGTATTGLPAGNYSYAIAYKTADGLYSAPTEFSSIVAVPANGWAQIRFNNQPLATSGIYRIYRKLGEVISYFDTKPSIAGDGVGLTVFDAGATATAVTLPDSSWLENADVNYQTVQSITPTFLNMEGQLGIFSTGTRLGFWDSANSVAWSSIDDYADFTPSIQTLAGSSIFNAVLGKIITIRTHGEDFLIYSTRNIVLAKRAIEATFLVEAKEILGSGIAYSNEVAVGNPSDLHYAWTSEGMYKISKGKPELIIEELRDYLRLHIGPLYLQVVEGRYLFLHCLDKDFIDGNVSFKVDTLPATQITLPSDSNFNELITSDIVLTGNDFCYALTGAGMGAGSQGAAGAGASGAGKPPKDPNGHYEPIYDAYFSYGHVQDADNITWVDTPCGLGFAMSPSGNNGKLTRLSQDGTNKLHISDTTFDPISFYQTQLAIWAMEDSKREAFLSAILNRTQSSSQLLGYSEGLQSGASGDLGANNPALVNPYTDGIPSLATCDQGSFVAGFGSPFWGINSCSFWVCRYATKIMNVQTVKIAQNKAIKISPTAGGFDGWYGAFGKGYSDPFGNIKAYVAAGAFGGPSNVRQHRYIPSTQYSGYTESYLISNDSWTFSGSTWDYLSYRFESRNQVTAYNTGQVQVGIFGVDVGYLTLVGWRYTDINGNTQVVPAPATCVRPDLSTPSGSSSNSSTVPSSTTPMDDSNGSMCGIPFTPVTIPGISDSPIEWPSQSVTLPPAAFLLQKGSAAPMYPTFYGALVYDTHLKKWGKLNQIYLSLVDFLPINTKEGEIVPVTSIDMKSGILLPEGKIRLFDDKPIDSYIKYGKIGYYRTGMTNCEEVKLQFRNPANCALTVEGSLDGKNIEARIIKTASVRDTMTGQLLANITARWYNIVISGNYDITYIEFRGVKTARR